MIRLYDDKLIRKRIKTVIRLYADTVIRFLYIIISSYHHITCFILITLSPYHLIPSLYSATITKGTGGTPAYFLELGGSARTYGLGRAFTGISDDAALIYYNPAGFINLTEKEIKPTEIKETRHSYLTLTHNQLFEGTRFDNILFVTKPHQMLGIGVGIINMVSPAIQLRDENNYILDGEIKDINNAGSVSCGITASKKLALGGTLKIINKNFDDINSTGIDADIGVLCNIFNKPKISAGVCAQNLLGYELKREYTTDKAKLNIRTGLGVKLFDELLSGSVDIVTKRKTNEFHLGAEANLSKYLKLRLGYDKGNLAGGFGILYKHFQLDYAVLNSNFGFSHRVSLSVLFKTVSVKEKETKLVFKRDDTGKINFAVVDLRAISPVATSDAVFLSTFFRKEILKNEQFNLLDRNNMDRILAEQGFQQTGCTTSECIVQIGKLLNMNYILTGDFGKLGDKYLVTVQITEIESGKIIYTDRETLVTLAPEPAEDCVKTLLSRLFNKTE
ncbi:MAG: hypothetical protein AB1349_10970 [Elusimicrobiota bacterium]